MNRIKRLLLVSFFFLPSCSNTVGVSQEIIHEESSKPDAKQSGWIEDKFDFQSEDGRNLSLSYGIYVPSSYQEGCKLPLITYVPDNSYVGMSVKAVSKAACLKYWLSDSNMKENPCFFLIFSFPETVTDCVSSPYGEEVVPIIDMLSEKYGIDEERLYLTGQSMGGILDFSLNDRYPEKFKASVYVGCQMGGEVHDSQYESILERGTFKKQKFIYIASRKDEKAPFGQDDIVESLKKDGIPFGIAYGLDHRSDQLGKDISEILEKGYDINFFGFEQLSSNGEGVAEHMLSFAASYKIQEIFSWLLRQ